ncbi:hypothetical protein C8R45DRAFT_930275 [Mycena sanguinolenta]|nr:hypothetical protein C8R45DRAFT_930275 [Mycena sanguinolenta]
MSLSATFRCLPPFHTDPGATQATATAFYLVLNATQSEKCGVYTSSTSAAKAGRVMKYASWDECLLAWHAYCDSGKHDHPSRRVLSTDSSPSKPSSTRAHTALASNLTTPQCIPVFTHHPPTRNPVSASSLALPATALNYTVLGGRTIHTTLEPTLADLRQAGAAGAATLYMTDNAVVASHVAAGVASL